MDGLNYQPNAHGKLPSSDKGKFCCYRLVQLNVSRADCGGQISLWTLLESTLTDGAAKVIVCTFVRDAPIRLLGLNQRTTNRIPDGFRWLIWFLRRNDNVNAGSLP